MKKTIYECRFCCDYLCSDEYGATCLKTKYFDSLAEAVSFKSSLGVFPFYITAQTVYRFDVE